MIGEYDATCSTLKCFELLAARAALSAFVPADHVGGEDDASKHAQAIRPKVC